MRRSIMTGVALATVILIGPMGVDAQHHMGRQHQQGGRMSAESQQEQSQGHPAMPGRGMMGMPMMCQMMGPMGGHMDLLAMGAMGGDQGDVKTMGRMLQLRGDLLKAMGDVLLKHGKVMEEAP